VPVIGTPVPGPPPTTVTGLGQALRVPKITRVFDEPAPAKERAVSARQGQNATVDFQMFDDLGNPVDLTNVGPIAIGMKFTEVVLGNVSEYSPNAGVVVTTTGEVSGHLPPHVSANAGLFWIEAGVYQKQNAIVQTRQVGGTPLNHVTLSATNNTYNLYLPQFYTVTVVTAGAPPNAVLTVQSGDHTDDVPAVSPAAFGAPTPIGNNGLTVTFTLNSSAPVDAGVSQPDQFVLGQSWSIQVCPSLVFSNQLYLYVEPSRLINTGNVAYGRFPFPTLQFVRLNLMDNDPADNRLIRDFEYDLADVCSALECTVRHWNTSQPPIDVFYDSIVYQYYIPTGYTAQLMNKAALRYLRNHLPYQGGGLSIDDQRKYDEYTKIASMKWKDYTDYVYRRKVQFNAEMAFGAVPSGYSWYRPY